MCFIHSLCSTVMLKWEQSSAESLELKKHSLRSPSTRSDFVRHRFHFCQWTVGCWIRNLWRCFVWTLWLSLLTSQQSQDSGSESQLNTSSLKEALERFNRSRTPSASSRSSRKSLHTAVSDPACKSHQLQTSVIKLCDTSTGFLWQLMLFNLSNLFLSPSITDEASGWQEYARSPVRLCCGDDVTTKIIYQQSGQWSTEYMSKWISTFSHSVLFM